MTDEIMHSMCTIDSHDGCLDRKFLLKEIQRLQKELVNSKQLNILEAVEVLADLRGKIENEHWVTGPMKRAVISGIRMCIKALENERAK